MVQGRPKSFLWVEILNIATNKNVFIGCKKKQNLYWTGRLLKIFYPCARDLVTIDTTAFVQIKPNDCLLYCHIYCLAYAHWSWSSKPNVVARFYSRHARQSSGRQGRKEHSNISVSRKHVIWLWCLLSSLSIPISNMTLNSKNFWYGLIFALFFVKTYVIIRLSPSRLFSQCCLLLQV